ATAGAVSGLLVACKITFVALLPFVALAVWLGAAPGRRWPAVAGLGLATLAGFALGAPYALLAPSEYFAGVSHLVNQSSGGHWPHGAAESGLGARLLFSGRYLLETCGWPTLLLFAIGAVVTLREGERRLLCFLVGIGATAVYFLQSAVFFERNLSHALPF